MTWGAEEREPPNLIEHSGSQKPFWEAVRMQGFRAVTGPYYQSNAINFTRSYNLEHFIFEIDRQANANLALRLRFQAGAFRGSPPETIWHPAWSAPKPLAC